MHGLKRIFFTLKAQLDHIADDIENHEAVAEVAIKELETYQTKVRMHRHRLQQMVGEFETRQAELRKEADLWTARAVKSKGQDEIKALECVRRMLQAQRQAKEIDPQLAKTRQQVDQLSQDLADIQAQLQALATQKEVLAARQNRIQIQAGLRPGDANPTAGAQAVFKRWEQSVVGAELSGSLPAVKDDFADAFVQEESELELKMLLDELTSKDQDK